MSTKAYITILFTLFLPFSIMATGLSSDVIYINGEEWSLMGKPIDHDSTLYGKLANFLPENHCVATNNWEGYTGFWEIRNNHLYLQKIEVCLFDNESGEESVQTFNVDALKEVFAPYIEQDSICARWFSGEVRVGKGDVVRYIHSAFDRNMETEQVMTLDCGKVLQVLLYHNYKVEGLSLDKSQKELNKRFPWQRFPELKGKKIFFSIRDFKVTNGGRLLDFDISSVIIRPENDSIEDDNHPVVKALKETMMSIYPWESFYVNGKYRMEFPSISMPIWED